MMKAGHWKSVLLFFILTSPAHSFSDYSYGVNFQVIRSPLLPLDNPALEKGKISGRATLRYMNVWSRQKNYFMIDGEEAQTEATVRYALTDSWSLGGAFSYISQGGGTFDSSIETFHSATGVTQGGRRQYPRNRINVSYEPFGKYYGLIDDDPVKTFFRDNDYRKYPRDSSDPPTSAEAIAASKYRDFIFFNTPFAYTKNYPTEIIALSAQDRMGKGNPRIFTEADVYKGNMISRVRIGMQIKFPVHNSYMMASPGTDYALFVTLEKRLSERSKMKGAVSHNWFGSKQFYSFELPKTRWVFRSSYTFNLTDTSNLFIEYVATEAPFRNFGRLGKPVHQLGFGLQKIFESGILTVGFAEDIINFAASPDIGVFASFEGKY